VHWTNRSCPNGGCGDGILETTDVWNATRGFGADKMDRCHLEMLKQRPEGLHTPCDTPYLRLLRENYTQIKQPRE